NGPTSQRARDVGRTGSGESPQYFRHGSYSAERTRFKDGYWAAHTIVGHDTEPIARSKGPSFVTLLLHQNCTVQHVHATGEGNLATLGWREFNDNGLVQRQRSLDVERWGHDLGAASFVGCTHERDACRCTGAKRHFRRLIALLVHDHLRSLDGLVAVARW